MNQENILRQCAITKKMFPRTELFRLVKTKEGKIFFDKEYKILGRGIHFSQNPKIVSAFFDMRKRKMVNHFLKAEISEEEFEVLKNEVLKKPL